MSRNSFYRKSFEIVGYSYDADVHCVDCTCKYLAKRYPHPHERVEHDDYQGFGNWGRDAYGEKFFQETFEDSEGNEMHPIFLDQVADYDDTYEDGGTELMDEYCGDCGERID